MQINVMAMGAGRLNFRMLARLRLFSRLTRLKRISIDNRNKLYQRRNVVVTSEEYGVVALALSAC
jgi:hypothetical protein